MRLVLITRIVLGWSNLLNSSENTLFNELEIIERDLVRLELRRLDLESPICVERASVNKSGGGGSRKTSPLVASVMSLVNYVASADIHYHRQKHVVVSAKGIVGPSTRAIDLFVASLCCSESRFSQNGLRLPSTRLESGESVVCSVIRFFPGPC